MYTKNCVSKEVMKKVMKKVVINIALVLLIFVCYFLQSNFFSWFTIAGVSPNLFVIFIVFVGLFGNKFMGVTYGLFLGFFLDYLFRSKVGISAIGLALIGILAKVFDKNFLQNLRFASEICFNINVNTHNLLTFGFGGVKCVII